MTEKQFNVFDVDGTVFLEDHKEGSYHIGEKENVDIPCLNDIADRLNTYADENEQLKSEIAKLSYANEDLLTEKRNWFVLSNEYGELYDKHEKKKEHQRVLENKIHRMRKSIHKLEWLAHHRNAELLRENEQLKEVLGNILVELKRYHNITKCDEIKVFINPHTSDLISGVFRKYGSLREE